MVERIEGFCTEDEWKRAYREINHFERQLVDFGTILFKFWIHISQEEQMQRFSDREKTAYKAWKLTDEDWRNREKWGAYEEAVNDMLLKTSTLTAPWTVVEGNCKWYARVKVLQTLVDGLSKELNFDPYAEVPSLKKDGKKKRKKKKEAKKKKTVKEEVAESASTTTEELPMVGQFEFGAIEIDGKTYESDVMILPDGTVKPWEHEDEHTLTLKDLRTIVEHKPELIVIGLGTIGNIVLEKELEEKLQEDEVEVMAFKTEKACETYNAARGQLKVAAILHVTC
jgi:hypothetical protein